MDKKLSMYREIRGYSSGDKKQPIYAPMPGQLVTQAFIHCSQCGDAVSSNMGPRRDAWCIPCTDKGEETAAKEKVAARKKTAIETARKKAEDVAKAKAEAAAKLQAGVDRDE